MYNRGAQQWLAVNRPAGLQFIDYAHFKCAEGGQVKPAPEAPARRAGRGRRLARGAGLFTGPAKPLSGQRLVGTACPGQLPTARRQALVAARRRVPAGAAADPCDCRGSHGTRTARILTLCLADWSEGGPSLRRQAAPRLGSEAGLAPAADLPSRQAALPDADHSGPGGQHRLAATGAVLHRPGAPARREPDPFELGPMGLAPRALRAGTGDPGTAR